VQDKKNALMLAAGKGHTEVVGLLLAAGADINAQGKVRVEEACSGAPLLANFALLCRMEGRRSCWLVSLVTLEL
jgi:ankyrin repeat protein